MMTDRANAICLLEILREHSDEEHILAMRDIIHKMNTLYDLKPDRRTIYSAVALLIDLGYDISVYEDNGIGYYLRGRDFEQSEILLLTDAVYSFPFIPAKQAEELIAKLQKQLSIHKRKQYRHLTTVRQEKKTGNRQVFLNIELLDEAIQQKRQVTFFYMQYGIDKTYYPRKEKPYTVNPYGMVFMNEHYYLVCNRSGYPNMSLYRIDRMKDIIVTDKSWDRTSEGMSEVIDAVYSFVGNPEYIKMRCDNVILDDVIDKFGLDIKLCRANADEFEATFKVSPHGVKFWALQYLPYAEILEPKWLREEIIESVKANKYKV